MTGVEHEVAMYTAWLDVVKDFAAVAAATLVVPIVFFRKVIGVGDAQPIRRSLAKPLAVSWGAIFLALLLSFVYRIGSTCKIGEQYVARTAWSCWIPLQPTFVVMALLYLVGVGPFGGIALRELFSRREGHRSKEKPVRAEDQKPDEAG